jgi:LacI family gluconate utilization system Gnt-I transcriptional repressor
VSADDARAEVRRKGFLSVLERNGITDTLTVYVPAPSSFQLGREGLKRLLELGPLPRAVFCSSDTLAHGMLTEAFAAHTFPPLSTVRIDRNAIGRLAAEALLGRIEGKQMERIINIGFEIMERGTT